MTNRPLSLLLMSALFTASSALPAYAGHNQNPALQAWVDDLEKKVARHMGYPVSAANAKEEGLVKLRVGLDTAGRIASAKIISSSGHERLDQAALKLAKRLEESPAPPSMNGKRIQAIRLHLQYKLAPDYNLLATWAERPQNHANEINVDSKFVQSNTAKLSMFLETGSDTSASR